MYIIIITCHLTDYISTSYLIKTVSGYAILPGLHRWMLFQQDGISTDHLSTMTSVCMLVTSVPAISPGLHQCMLSHQYYISACYFSRTTSVHAISPRLYQHMLFHQDYISTCYFTRTTSVHAVSPGLHQYMLSHLDSINTCHLTRTISVHAISSGLHQYMSDQDYVSTCYLTRTTSGHAISLGLHQHMLSHQDFKVWDRVCAEAWPVKGHSVGVVHSVQRLNGAREQSVLRLPQASCAKTALHQSIYLPLLLPHIMAPSISQYICHFYCLTS